TYWIVVVVGRGSASWSLGRFDAAGTAVPIRRGSTTGSWHELPSAVIDRSTIGARIRAIGKAPPSAPVAPLQLSVAGQTGPRVNAEHLQHLQDRLREAVVDVRNALGLGRIAWGLRATLSANSVAVPPGVAFSRDGVRLFVDSALSLPIADGPDGTQSVVLRAV